MRSYTHRILNDHGNTRNRTEEVLNLLRVSHLNAEETDASYDLCSTYSDIFHLPNDKLTNTDVLQHKITTSNFSAN